MPNAIVIGAGFGGIAAALRLRARGYEVTLIDKQDQLGGRAYQFRRETPLGTFVHDAGPTVITAKFLFDELFALFGKRREDYATFVDLYPWYRIVFADGSHFDYGGTIEQTEAQIRKFEPDALDGFRRYLDHSKRIFDVGFTELGAVPFHRLGTMLRCAPDLVRLQNHKTVWQLASQYFNSDKLRRVFSFQPLLVGGNPFNTTSIYALIFYLEREWGIQFCMGGTGAIVRGLERLMREEQIDIRLKTEVTRIEPREAGATVNGSRRPFEVIVNGSDRLSSDIVVCNADAPFVYRHLLERRFAKGIAPRRAHSKVAPLKYSMGLFVLYFGTRRQFPDVPHHTIVLGNSYRELIDRIFDRHELETEDLSIYLHRPTATDPSMAPPGCDSFYCLVPVPNLLGGHDWSVVGPRLRDATVRYLERTVLPGLSNEIVDEFFVTPEHFAKNLNTLHGSGFSIQPLFSQSAYFRFHNKAPGIEGLYFVGAGTHPGAGMPGVLCSAKVLDHLVPDVRHSATTTSSRK
jgi:phytoene desaturase